VDYLQDCVASVLEQNFDDYELIVSDNHSADGAYAYIQSLNHPRLRPLQPDKLLDMVDHFEWALAQARGEWIIFLGSDDGVMPYFFELAEILTKKAVQKKLKVINSIRAYFFWKGCQGMYNNTALNYEASAFCTVRSAKIQLLNALIGFKYYIDLPQMYTTSLVHRTVVEKVIRRNNGKFYNSIVPDANGAANICLTEKKYLESHLPLSWVGTSPKSNGLRYSVDRNAWLKEYAEIYAGRSAIKWNPLAGEYGRQVHNFKIYLYESLLQTKRLQPYWWRWFFNTKIFKTLLFANVYADIKTADSKNLEFLKEAAAANNISFASISFCRKWIVRFVWSVFYRMEKIKNWAQKKDKKPRLELSADHSEGTEFRLLDASRAVKELIIKNGFNCRL
jgi:glycosyltransferase involved in cell wall biosynthesis